MSVRAGRAAVAVRLRAEGKLLREIAAALGVSRSYASELYADPDGLQVAARRASYRGVCEDCGTPTHGSNGRAKAPRRCAHCEPGSPEARERRTKRTKWPAELILARIREWADTYGEPPAIADWFPWKARAMGDEDRARRFEDANGHWPWMTLVVDRFGSWNAAIVAAGFEPRAAHGGGGNQQRRRFFAD